MELSGKSYHFQLTFNWVLQQLWLKLVAIFYRIIDVFKLLPLRILRVIKHLWIGLKSLRPKQMYWWESEINNRKLRRLMNWWVELMVYFLECFGLGEFYETINDLVKFNARALKDWEIQLAQTVFGDNINYRRVRIDEYAFLGPKQARFCYVSFNLVNSWGPMLNSLLLHELTHVWQYQTMGAVYIPRALRAQYSNVGYNYGGVSNLRSFLKKGKDLHAFNLEQQADIVADYYLIKDGYKPNWGNGNKKDLPIYEAFINQIRNV